MRKQYHLRASEDGGPGRDAWDVDSLIELTVGLPIVQVLIEDLDEIDTPYWFEHQKPPTVRQVVEHFRLLQAVDPSCPIIVGPDGRILDGMHRVARRLLEGRTTVAAVRLPELPPPDYRDCHPDDLPYER